MPAYTDNILGFIPEAEWLDVGTVVTRPNDPVDTLFGDEKTDNLFAKWQSIASVYNIPVMAQFHGFDTESQTAFRIPVDINNIEKGLIKVKINQSERMRALLRSGVRNDEIYRYVIDDAVNLADQVATRTKVAKNELLATGKVTIKENNLDLTVDYGVANDQTNLQFDLSASADIVGQIEDIIDKAKKKGVILTGFVTNSKNIAKMKRNTGLQTAVNGSISAGRQMRNGELTNFLNEEFGLDRIVVNNLTYGISDGFDANKRPKIIQKNYFPENKITFFAANPAGKLGVGLWGEPPESTASAGSKTNSSGVSPFIKIDQWSEKDPDVLWTRASALFMPVLYNPSSLFISTVKPED